MPATVLMTPLASRKTLHLDDLIDAVLGPRNELSAEQAEAAEKFVAMHERSLGARDPLKRTIALDAFRAAKAVLRPDEGAIMDLVVIKGRSLSETAAKAGRPKEYLELLLIGACEKLAVHFKLKPSVRDDEVNDPEV